MAIHGVDVSAYQSSTYSTAGLDFVFTKITEGLSYISPRWAAQRDRAKSAGLVWGAYHYPHMANEPRAEADCFLKQVAWKPGDIIALDWEGYDSANKSVPKSRQVAYRDAWLKYVKGKMPGHRVGIYANTDYWLHVDTTSNCGDFLWIATAGRPAGDPGITHPWTFHQYSTAGGIDHDVANFPTRAALAAWAAGTASAPQEDTVSLTADQAKQLAALYNERQVAPWQYKGTGETLDAYAYLRGTRSDLKALAAKVDAQGQTIDQLVKTVAQLATGVGGLDPAAIVSELKQAIESIHINLDVPES